ncbi:MAG: response regulator [Anaerolineae bacterium]
MNPKRILLADDDELSLQLLKIFFDRMIPGYQITTVKDGAEALAQLLQHPFDLILTDYHMPRVNGLELARSARRISPNIPVILMSGCTYADLEIQDCSINLNGFLAKPFTVLDLKQLLQQTA